MIFEQPLPEPDAKRAAVRAAYRADETEWVRNLADAARLSADERAKVDLLAGRLVHMVRAKRRNAGGLDAFLHEYELSSQEGVMLMCLAEALLRIPDAATQDKLIKDKIGDAAWADHLGHSESLFVNASTWGLMLTGRVVQLGLEKSADWRDYLGNLVARSGEPVIRRALNHAMRIMGRQFVLGRTIAEALERAAPAEAQGYRHSYDMLGEAARTMPDAERYFGAYAEAIRTIGESAVGNGPANRPGISVKLSALHPRYEFSHRGRVMGELLPRLKELALAAKEHDLGFCIDAEEADRLDLSLDVIESLALDPELAGWDGFGLAVQAYQKRALPLIDWLADLARRAERRLMVRLVKGAYWDTEIKVAQEGGEPGYPVFTRKTSTDVSFLACARRLLASPDAFFSQFATHNAHSVAAVMAFAGNSRDFEFQRLHGMGEPLYEEVVGDDKLGVPCRVYAPVGSHEDLLAYLVRRLLENGANSSFVNRIFDDALPVQRIIADPVDITDRLDSVAHPSIPLPADLYGAERKNSAGTDLTDPVVLRPLDDAIQLSATLTWSAGPIVGGETLGGKDRKVTFPADRRIEVGAVCDADGDTVDRALTAAAGAARGWDATPAADRGAALRRAADLYEENHAELMALCIREAGKTLPDCVAEVREAVDFLRYYAARAEADFGEPVEMPGPTGETNRISLHGRGAFVCVSPWNFPLAIFTGQVAAALAAGNAVLAKPAEQTSIVASRAVALLHEAGVPGDVLHLLPGDGPSVGARLIGDPRVAGVAFTGSTETARLIQRSLAEKDGPIVPLIAETGGQNAMIVDSSALPEQVVADVIQSAFNSAGQRCSALRVLFLQRDIADRTVEMLKGAMAELRVGNPGLLSTDVGPVIDADAKQMLDDHAQRMREEGTLLYETELPADCAHGTFVAPKAFEIDSLTRLKREVFGPILHVVRYNADRLDDVCDAVNATGYGLTLGVHSRIDETARRVVERIKVGNAYVNRNTVGAVVGVQPFGGEGLSGTGPKAGGPRYLYRFATERALSINTAAAGGNAALMTLAGEEADA